MTAKVFAIANQKGGVGKTTTALSLAAAFARLGKKSMVIDLDPHASATIHLAYFPEQLSHSSLDLFDTKRGDDEAWEKAVLTNTSHGFDFVPASVNLSDLESDFKGKSGKGLLLSRRLEAIKEDYDFILIDCPPQVGVLLINAIVASDMVIIPIQTEFLALHGVKLIFETLRMLNKAMPRKISYRALATMYDRRAGACRRVLLLLRKRLNDKLFETIINTDTNFREASAAGKVIIEHTPDSRGALEYMRLAREIVQS